MEAGVALDTALWICGVAEEAALILLLIRIRVFKTFPAFFLFVCWSFVNDVLVFALKSIPQGTFFKLYEAEMVIDSAMMFAVLVELAWSVLRPIRSSLPRGSWIGIALLIALAGLLLWPVAGFTLPPYLTSQGANFFRLQQTFAILRVVIFLAMAGFSQVLAIGWRSRELQIATGLGFYSIVSLGISVLHTHQIVGPQYHWLDDLGVACYLSSLAYWVLSFATKEVKPKNFSPQMESFLLLVGGTARAERVALSDSVVTKTRSKEN